MCLPYCSITPLTLRGTVRGDLVAGLWLYIYMEWWTLENPVTASACVCLLAVTSKKVLSFFFCDVMASACVCVWSKWVRVHKLIYSHRRMMWGQSPFEDIYEQISSEIIKFYLHIGPHKEVPMLYIFSEFLFNASSGSANIAQLSQVVWACAQEK